MSIVIGIAKEEKNAECGEYMAKRSKKKNPNALTEKQKADIIHNQALDVKKSVWDKKLNITLGVVIGIALIAFLLLPALDMNFSSSLSEFLGDSLTSDEDQVMSIDTTMSYIDFLFAMTKGYSDSFEYIANSNSSGLGATIIYNAFLMKSTPQDLDMAYIVAFVLSILLLIAIVILITIVVVKRSKKQDGIALLTAVIIFSAISIVQWIFFVAVGIASAGRGQIQPHIASYLMLACAITLSSVYGVYRRNVKKLDREKRPVEEAQNAK